MRTHADTGAVSLPRERVISRPADDEWFSPTEVPDPNLRHWRFATLARRKGMTNSCRVVLWLLSGAMDEDGVVSVPAAELAGTLGITVRAARERIALGEKLGLLVTVEPARGHTPPVYRATFPDGSNWAAGS